jgi:hypothetical protein
VSAYPWEAQRWAREQTVSGKTASAKKFVLVMLAVRAGDNGGEWSCFPSQATLAKDCQMGERSIRRHLASLEEDDGLIRREMRHRDDGTRSSDRIILLVGQPANLAASDGDNRPTTTGQPATGGRAEVPGEVPDKEKRVSADADAPSDDVVNLCALLAELVETDVGLRPKITNTWRKNMRLLLERGPVEYEPAPISAASVERLIRFVYEHRDADPNFSWAAQMRAPSGVRRNWVKAVAWAKKYRDRLEREERGEDDDSWMIRSVRAEEQT